MAEVAAALGMLKCMGSMIPQCIPQELKDKLTRPVSYVIFYGSNAADIPTKIEQLKRAKVEVEARLLVAQTNGDQIRDTIQTWLNDTDKILLEFEGPEENKCLCGSGSSCEVGKMLDEIKKMLEQLKGFQWVTYPGSPPPIGSRYHAYNKSLYTRENVLVKIFNALKDSSTNMFPVCGVPGVGKTTLLEELVKRVEADEMFQVIAKVGVSQTWDTRMIQTSIAMRIQLHLPEQGDEETWANLLYQQLQSRLLEKRSKILLVFDDICTESDFDLSRIGIPFLLDGEPSCKILLSSRSSDVCNSICGSGNILQLDYLSPAEAKILFRDRLGTQITDEEYTSESYISMENDLLQKCGNLPRAITTVADVLRVRWPDWDDVVNQLRIHNLSQVDGVKKTLHQSNKLSYNLLEDDRKKKIFLLCCLFQPGTSIAIESLIRYGIGLNLFDKIISLDDVMQRANLLVNNLKSMKLFESKDEHGCIVVHTIIHEFAISTALEEEYLLLLDEGDRWETKENFKKYTIISLTTKSSVKRKRLNREESSDSMHDFEHLSGLKLPKLEALFLQGESSNLHNSYFAGTNNLRVLVMTKLKLSALPPSIKNLNHLVTFCVEYCKIKDASGVGCLLGLKVLSFRGSKLESFPSGIRHLMDLRLLDLTECVFRTSLDGVLANLSHLEGLYTAGTATGSLVRELKSFQHLVALEIEIPSNSFLFLDVRDLLLGRNPLRFNIAIGGEVLSKYRNFFKCILLLKGIDARICMKPGLRKLLKKVECLSLGGITNLKKVFYDLDEDGLVNLNYLHISNCNQMECMVSTTGMSADFKILPELETLTLEQLDGLEVIYHGRTPQNWCSKLRELKLLNLRELKRYALLIDHAQKLVALDVRDCASLQHIFSSCSTSEIRMTDDRYDFPYLKKLDLRRLPTLRGLWTDDNNEDQVFFHEKINLPALEKLYLSSLDNIQELWKLSPCDSASSKAAFLKLQILHLDKMHGLKHVWINKIFEGIYSFGSLKKISIVDCELLESLCPPSVLAALPELHTLEITSCSNLKEVIMTETSKGSAIKFPSLKRLKLKKLSSLQRFSQGRYTIDFPSLEKLSLSALPKTLTFHESRSPTEVGNVEITQVSNPIVKQMPFITEIVFPSLDHLKLTAMEDIEELINEEHATAAFPNLKTITIKDLGKLKFVPAALLEKAEQLKVHSCGSLQDLFECNFATSMLSLGKLELVDVRSLENVPLKLIPNIYSLAIHGGLLGVKSMLSSTAILEGVVQKLEYLNIKDCNSLQEIVSKECDQPDLLKNGTAMFPRLKHLIFDSLPLISTFTSGSYEATFPTLEKVEISRCPNIVSFSMGRLQTPKLSTLNLVKEDGDQISITLQDIDLNCILKEQKKGNHRLQNGSEQSQELLQSTEHGIGLSNPPFASEEPFKIPINELGIGGADHTSHNPVREEIGEPKRVQITLKKGLYSRVEAFRKPTSIAHLAEIRRQLTSSKSSCQTGT
ncbi:hypothetical protein V2J09_022015 [Rumex salicifolius]